jgi:hypothetical protein
MKKLTIMLLAMLIVNIASCQINQQKLMKKENITLSCKLTTPELQERKRTVIAELKSLLLEKDEIETGFRYRFEGSDKMIDTLASFVKTERLCCDFFQFTLTIAGENDDIWLELTGPEGVKDFIRAEIGI